MNRRHLIVGTMAAVAAGAPLVTHAAAPKRPKPNTQRAEIAPGLEFLYYQIIEYPEYGTWGIFTEARNTTETMLDSVSAGFRFSDPDGNILYDETAFAISRVVGPGETIIAYTYVANPEIVTGWQTLDYAYGTNSWGLTNDTERIGNIKFAVENINVNERGDGFLNGYIDVKNIGTQPSEYAIVHVISRNERGRIVQIERTSVSAPIEPGKFARTEISNSIYAPGVDVEYVVAEA